MPATFLGVGVAMAGIHWIVKRRQKLAAESAGLGTSEVADAGGEAGTAQPGSERADKEGS